MSTWDMRRTVGAIGVAVAVAGVGGAAIAAATDGGHPMMDGAMWGPGGGSPGRAAEPRHGDADLASVHAVSVVADGRGGFSTKVSQTGRITAVSAASVSVRSDDGFATTYVVPPTVQPRFSVGDEVTIEATREGEAAMVDTMRPPLASSRLGR